MIKNKIIAGIGIFALVAVIGAVLIFTSALEAWDLKLQNSLYEKTADISQNIVIVAIDSKSLDENLGLGRFQNWRRTFYAKALDRIEEGAPKLVVFDVLFNTKTRGVPEESIKEKFEEMKSLNAENTPAFIEFLKSFISDKTHPDDVEFAQEIAKYSNVLLAMNASISTKEPTAILEASSASLPLEILAKATIGIGSVNIMPDSDNVARRIPQKINYKNETYTPLIILTAKKALNTAINIPSPNEPMLINFKNNRTSDRFKKFSFVDVYGGKINPAEFKDKIVLIGATALSLQDLQFTPVSTSTPMPGVEIQAHAVETILTKDFLQPVTPFASLAIAALLAGLIIFISLRLNFQFGIAGLVLAPPAYFFIAKFALSRGIVLSLIYSFAAILIAYLASLIYRYFTEYREKRFIKGAFGHYVNPSVVEEIMRKPELLRLGGIRKEITVIFTDIENFTPMSESLQPEILTNILNRYFDKMSGIILANNGTVDKFVGDAVMAFFNAPLDQQNHAYLACKSVLEMRLALEDFNKELAAENHQAINFRAGISTGEAVVGNLGSKDRFDYTAIGDTVNIASRLETANKELGTHALVSAKTYEYAKNDFTFREIDSVRLKGKSEALKVYELI